MRWQMNRRLGAVLLSLLGAVLLSACEFLNPPVDATKYPSSPPAAPATAAPSPNPGEIVKVKQGNLVASLKVRGRVVAANELPLSFRRGGWIKSLGVKIGDQVEKGAMLAEIEDPDLDDRVHSARFSLEAAQVGLVQSQLPLPLGRSSVSAAEVEIARLKVEAAKLKLERLKAAPTEEDLISYRAAEEKARVVLTKAQSDYDSFAYLHGYEASPEARALHTATLNLQVAQADLNRLLKGPRSEDIALAESDVRAAQAGLEVAKASYEYEVELQQARAAQREAAIRVSTVTVRQREADLQRQQALLDQVKLVAPFAGSIVSLDVQVGDRVGPFQSLGILADPHQIEVEASVPEGDMQWVSPGQESQIVMDGFPGQRHRAKVEAIASKPTLWQGKQVYQVRLGFVKASDVPATIRMGSDVFLDIVKSQALSLPRGAVQGDEGKRYVEMSSGSSVTKVPVVTGLATDSEMEIVSGLRPGDSVLVRPNK